MRFQFELTEQDFMAFNFFYLQNSPVQRRQLRNSRFLFAAIPIVVGGVSLFLNGMQDLVFSLFLFAVGIGGFFFFPKLFTALVKKNMKRMLNEKRNTWLGHRTLIFEDEQFRHITQYVDEATKYKAIVDLKETPDAIYLFTGPHVAVILPKCAIESEEARVEVIEFLKSRLSI